MKDVINRLVSDDNETTNNSYTQRLCPGEKTY